MVENCRVCLQHKVKHPEPLNPTPFPECPWQELGADFFQCQSCDYLIVVDYYSRYIEVAAMTKNKKESEVVRALKAFLLDVEYQKRFNLITALLSTVVSTQDLQMIGDLKSPQVAQNFPDQMEKQSMLYRLQNQF